VKKGFRLLFVLLFSSSIVFCQLNNKSGTRILFNGLVSDAITLTPLPNSQIFINSEFSSVSSSKGTFTFYVNRNDTVVFRRVGYKTTQFFISDTLTSNEFITGVYLFSDTISIGDVIIIPRLTNLRNKLMNSMPETTTEMENAKYNIAVSSYIGRNSTNKLGDPATNYELLRQKQRTESYERGSILPSDRMIGLSPLMLIPAAYLLLHGLPDKPNPPVPQLTDKEVNQIHDIYLESLKKKR
jgi:hypothetical protein